MWMTTENNLFNPCSFLLWRSNFCSPAPQRLLHHWHKAKDCTSSSPSSLHFGHYKAESHAHAPDHTFLHACFTQLVSCLVSLPLNTSQDFRSSWKKGRQNPCWWPSCHILLMEADLSVAMKLFLGHSHIPGECFGSHQGSMTIQVVWPSKFPSTALSWQTPLGKVRPH